MSLFLSAITTQAITIVQPNATIFSAGTFVDLLSPDGEFTLEDIRSSADLQSKVNSGDVIITSGDNEVLVNLSTAGINYFNTYNGIVSRDVSFEGNLSGSSLFSGSTELSEIIENQIGIALSAITGSYFDAYDSVGGTTTITTNWTSTVPLDSQRQIDSSFSHSTVTNNDEVTINEKSKYLVIGRVSTENSTASDNRT